MYAIETNNLTKVYDKFFFWKGRPALDHLTMKVPEGKVFGYLGPNGAGKTTTLRLLLGLTFPSDGGARVLGEDIGSTKARNKIGYLAENARYYEYLKASEFLDYYAKIFRIPRAERKKQIEELLEYVGLKEEISSRLKTFSRGMLQRVGLAQAMLNDPDLLLLDEPMVGLDPLGRKQFKNLIKRASHERKKTVFFCSHILADAEEICDFVGIISKGKLLVMDELEKLPHEKMVLITTRNAPKDFLTSLELDGFDVHRQENDTVVVRVPKARADEIKGKLQAAKAECLDTKEKRETLEELFIRLVTEAERRT